MLKITLNNKEYKIETITTVKFKKVLAFKKRQRELSVQGLEDEMFEDMTKILVDLFSYLDGDKVVNQFTKEDVDNYLPLKDFSKTVNNALDIVISEFLGEDVTKKK